MTHLPLGYIVEVLPSGILHLFSEFDRIKAAVSAAFGGGDKPLTFLPGNHHIYRLGLGQHRTLLCIAHSFGPVRPTMWFLFAHTGRTMTKDHHGYTWWSFNILCAMTFLFVMFLRV